MPGAVIIPTSILDDPDYLSEKFSRPAAWMDLMLLAGEAGEVRASYSSLALRWKWSVNRVKRFLDELNDRGVVDTFHGTFHGKNTESIIIVKSENYADSGKNAERSESVPPSSPMSPSSLSPGPLYPSTPLPPSTPLESPGTHRMGARVCASRPDAGAYPSTPFPTPFVLSSTERDAVRMGRVTVVDCKRRHLAENLRIFAGEIGMAEDQQEKFLDWWCSPSVTNADEIRAESDQYFNLRSRAESWVARDRKAGEKQTSRVEKYVSTTQNFTNLVNAIYHADAGPADRFADSPDDQ